MSGVLRKAKETASRAKDKAREGIRVVNAERKRHFRQTPTQQNTALNYRQVKQKNDMFEAILDDESVDLFGLEESLKDDRSLEKSHDMSHDSRSSNTIDDLFSDDLPSEQWSGDPLAAVSGEELDQSKPSSLPRESTIPPAEELFNDDIKISSSPVDNDNAIVEDSNHNSPSKQELSNESSSLQDDLFCNDFEPNVPEEDLSVGQVQPSSSPNKEHDSIYPQLPEIFPENPAIVDEDPQSVNTVEPSTLEPTALGPSDVESTTLNGSIVDSSQSQQVIKHSAHKNDTESPLSQLPEPGAATPTESIETQIVVLDEVISPSPPSKLDSGVFEAHSTSVESIDITEDHYTREPQAGRKKVGKTPPIRPPMSPNVRRRLNEKLSRETKSEAKSSRVVADDLFQDDQLKPSSHSQPSTPPKHDATPTNTTPVKPQSEKPQSKPETETKDRYRFYEEVQLTLPYHLALSVLLYLYYSFNPWSYLSGLLAGFLSLYLLVGTLFVWYVVSQEQEARGGASGRRNTKPSEDFLRRMNTDFEKVKDYQSRKFSATLKYDHNTHRPRHCLKAHVKLEEDFYLKIDIFPEGLTRPPYQMRQDLRKCTVTHLPEEVATNRKRRWNKKFPICITQKSHSLSKVFLFAPTSREKEDWFRRLRSAADGKTSDEIIKDLEEFFAYMQDYFPSSKPAGQSRRQAPKKQVRSNRIQYSRDNEDQEEASRESVSITRNSGPRVARHSRLRTPPSTEPEPARPLPSDTLWLNAVAARLAWDVWTDTRWKDWVVSRIQKKLARIPTPGFMERLTLTDVDLGFDMPKVNRLCGGPRLDLRGIWVYLDVTFEGCFVMTITTKLKPASSRREEPEPGQQMSVIKTKGSHSGFPSVSPHKRRVSDNPYDNEISSGSSDEESASITSLEDEIQRAVEPSYEHSGRTERGVKSAISWLGKKVVNSSIVKRAVDKASSYPLVLTVVVERLDGVVAVNIPPPTTDTIWFGFTESPKLQLTAKPRLGHREVKLSKVTNWIEKKLREVVNKKLVLPEMEDLVVKVLNSGLPEDTQKVLVKDSDQ